MNGHIELYLVKANDAARYACAYRATPLGALYGGKGGKRCAQVRRLVASGQVHGQRQG